MEPRTATAAGTPECLEWPRLLTLLQEGLQTDPGRAALEALALLADPAAIADRLALVSALQALQAHPGPLVFPTSRSLAPWLPRAEKGGRLEAEELRAVLAFQQGARRLAETLAAREEAPRLVALAQDLRPLDDLCAVLGRAFTAEGELDGRVYPELARLRRAIAQRRQAIHARLDALLRSRALAPALQERIYTLRGARYVVPVKADFRGAVPGIVHDVSASGATLFIEPQAVAEESNQLTVLEKELEAAVDAVLLELSGRVGAAADDLRANEAWVGALDLLHAQAVLSHRYEGTAPRVEAEGRLELRGVAHPFMLLAGERPVRNDLRLGGDERCLVISGANTGGKTVLLKAVGLCALMVRCGQPLPVRAGSRCDLFGRIAADVGDRQDIGDSLSTFSAQIRFLADVLASAGPGCLVLVDEILHGTEPGEGAALAGVVLEALVATGALTIVTTHYGDLKVLAAQVPGMRNASVSFDAERLQPTFRLQPGLPGASYAAAIARRHGLPAALVDAASARLADRPATGDALVAELHRREAALSEREEALARREAELAGQAGALAGRAAALERRERDLRERERGRISAELRQARRRIAGVIRDLQRANSLPTAGRLRERLDALEGELAPPAGPEGPPPTAAYTPETLRAQPLGATVRVLDLERDGRLEQVLKEGREARVSLGNVTLEVPAGRLSPAVGGSAPRPGRSDHPAQPEPGPAPEEAPAAVRGAVPTSENTLDLRGMRLEEAWEQAEPFFDRCVMKHVSPVLLIHGHGTGRLKAGVRARLEGCRYVAGFRPGAKGEGGDGVTVVALNL